MLRQTIILRITLLLCLFSLLLPSAVYGDSVRDVQVKLQERGFNPGPIDGLMGPKTRAALREFQRSRNLQVTGSLDEATQRELGVEFEPSYLPAETRIHVFLEDRLSSADSQQGERFEMTVAEAVVADNRVVIPRGARITGIVQEVEPAERPQKGGKLVLQPETLHTASGQSLSLQGNITAEGEEIEGEGSFREDLKRIGIGAGVGAVLGGLIKGGKGALVGILIGGGGTFLGTKGQQVELKPETRLIVELSEPVNIPAR